MRSAEWVALGSVFATVLVAAIAATTQIVLDRQRRKGERDQRKDERWLDQRLDLYARFLEGADECIQANRDRALYLYSLENGQLGEAPPPEDLQGPSSPVEGIEKCAAALSRMRLFAPAAVTDPAGEFIERTREIEYFGGLEVAKAHVWWVETDPNKPAEWTGRSGQRESDDPRTEIGEKLIAAMRDDLGADPASGVSLGNPAAPIPYL
ncbi:MAG: hypothetical protein FWF90_13300 [Promicromonosporaceae bacterium]|nr:hypothetical protein [Promicromonosporaceae bacterium]